jgi:hypothetical protein
MESTSINERKLTFPNRPSLNMNIRQNQRPVNLISNFMKVSVKPNNKFVSQYAIKIEPNVASDSQLLRKMIHNTMRKNLDSTFYPWLISGDSLFSAQQVEEIQVYNIQIRFNDTLYEYQIRIEKTKNNIDLENIRSINNFSQKVKSFIETVFKFILNANEGMVRFNKRSIFDFNKAFQLQDCGKKKFYI